VSKNDIAWPAAQTLMLMLQYCGRVSALEQVHGRSV